MYKTWTADCGLGIKHGLGIKRGLSIKCGLSLKIAQKNLKNAPFSVFFGAFEISFYRRLRVGSSHGLGKIN